MAFDGQSAEVFEVAEDQPSSDEEKGAALVSYAM